MCQVIAVFVTLEVSYISESLWLWFWVWLWHFVAVAVFVLVPVFVSESVFLAMPVFLAVVVFVAVAVLFEVALFVLAPVFVSVAMFVAVAASVVWRPCRLPPPLPLALQWPSCQNKRTGQAGKKRISCSWKIGFLALSKVWTLVRRLCAKCLPQPQ